MLRSKHQLIYQLISHPQQQPRLVRGGFRQTVSQLYMWVSNRDKKIVDIWKKQNPVSALNCYHPVIISTAPCSDFVYTIQLTLLTDGCMSLLSSEEKWMHLLLNCTPSCIVDFGRKTHARKQKQSCKMSIEMSKCWVKCSKKNPIMDITRYTNLLKVTKNNKS